MARSLWRPLWLSFAPLLIAGESYKLNPPTSCHSPQRCDAWNPPPELKRWADGCRHVFLDIGANRAVSVRKLFEPNAYPTDNYDWDNAGLPRWHCCRNHSAPNDHVFYAPIFDRLFGNMLRRSRDNFRGVCAFGFEMNPQHSRRLKEIEACYAARGWRVKLFTETAASDVDGNTTMRLAQGQDSEHNWGASILPQLFEKNTPWQTTVATIDLAEWLLEHVAKRKIPAGDLPPTVMAKMVSDFVWSSTASVHPLTYLRPSHSCRILKVPNLTFLGGCSCDARSAPTSYTR